MKYAEKKPVGSFAGAWGYREEAMFDYYNACPPFGFLIWSLNEIIL